MASMEFVENGGYSRAWVGLDPQGGGMPWRIVAGDVDVGSCGLSVGQALALRDFLIRELPVDEVLDAEA